MKLRNWQERGQRSVFDAWHNGQRDFLCEAFTGTGKTIYGLAVAYRALRDGLVDQVVIVAPQVSVVEAWAEKALQHFGMVLNPNYEGTTGSVLRDGEQGIVVTYQKVASDLVKTILRAFCRRRRTLVIFDEVHHCGDSLTWAAAIREAFEHATFRLSTTGTAFRSDSNPIPFVRYAPDVNGIEVCVPDFSYGYVEALRNRDVAEFYFPMFEGDLDWDYGDKTYRDITFSDDLSYREGRQRLRTAVETDFIDGPIARAHVQLCGLRERDRANCDQLAAALLIADSKEHARKLAAKIRGITGYDPIIITSDDKAAHAQIKAFRDGSEPWVVAVKMISEGVDIPRIRCIVYASTITTELFVYQSWGRGGRSDVCYVYMPSDPELRAIAATIMAQRHHALSPVEDGPVDHGGGDGNGTHTASFVRPIAGTARDGVTIYLDETYSNEEIQRATQLKELLNSPLEPAQIAKKLREGAFGTQFSGSDDGRESKDGDSYPTSPSPAQGQIKTWQGRHKRLVDSYVRRYIELYGTDVTADDRKQLYRSLRARKLPDGRWAGLNYAPDGKYRSVNACDISTLRRRCEILERSIVSLG